MKILLITFSLSAFLVLTGCGKQEVSDNSQSSLAEKQSSDPEVESLVPPESKDKEGHTREINYEYLNPEIVDHLKSLDEKYEAAPYYFDVDGEKWFYIANGGWEEFREEMGDQSNVKFGLVNEAHEEILPVSYDKIYNPDGTAEGFIEIEHKGKRGLFGYKNKVLIPCSYDLIFPTDLDDAIAIGKYSGGYNFLHEDGHTTALTSKTDIPRYSELGKKLKFDYLDNDIVTIHKSYLEQRDGEPEFPSGIKFLPSYLKALGFIPERMAIGKGQEDFRVTDANGGIVEVEEAGNGISAMITSFYEEGVDARGYQFEKSHLVTVDEDNNVFSTVELAEQYPNSESYACGKDEFKYRFLRENLLETISVEYTRSNGSHQTVGLYHYYEIKGNGTVEELKSDRGFACTQFVEMTEDHFKICWTDYVEPYNPDSWGEVEGDGNLMIGSHLTIKDLDIMRNEIYASYGYKFQNEKWQEYFGDQKWYRPQFDDVEDKLTAIDKHNIDLILEVKKKMIASPEAYPQPQRTWYVAAG